MHIKHGDKLKKLEELEKSKVSLLAKTLAQNQAAFSQLNDTSPALGRSMQSGGRGPNQFRSRVDLESLNNRNFNPMLMKTTSAFAASNPEMMTTQPEMFATPRHMPTASPIKSAQYEL